jgi:uncharacterized lipoprotein YmbA
MKNLILAVAFMSLTACATVQLEGVKYTLPNGHVASCIQHPEREGFMQCTYMDGVQEFVVAVKSDLLSE